MCVSSSHAKAKRRLRLIQVLGEYPTEIGSETILIICRSIKRGKFQPPVTWLM